MVLSLDLCISWKWPRIQSWCHPNCKIRTHGTSNSKNSLCRPENQQPFLHFELVRDLIAISLSTCYLLQATPIDRINSIKHQQIHVMATMESTDWINMCVAPPFAFAAQLPCLLHENKHEQCNKRVLRRRLCILTHWTIKLPWLPCPGTVFTTRLPPNYHYRTR